MRGLLKFILLAFSFCLNLSAIDLNSLSNEDFSLVRYSEYAPSGFSKVSGVEILNSQYLKIGDDYYTYTSSSIVFNLSFLRDSGFLAKKHSGKIIELVNYDSSFDKIKIPCQKSGDIILACSRKYKPEIPGYIEQEFSYYEKYFVAKVASCQPDEHFNTFTKQCQKCPDGQSWNPQTNSCFTDCTDEKTNKYGWADGSCTDCSAAKTDGEVFKCFCGSLGLGVPETFESLGVMGKPGYFSGKCSNGYSFEFKSPDYKPDPKPDDNTTKPDNPDPQPDPNNPQPDPGGDNGGGGNSGGGGNGGGSGDNPNPNPNPGGGSGDNPDPKPNPNPGGGSGGGGNGGKDDGKNKDGEAKFKESDFNSDGLNKEMGAFEKAYKDAFSKIEKEFEGAEGFNAFKNGIDQFINNLKGKGLNDISKKSVPKSCSRKETIDFFGYNVVMDFDFCKIVEPASDAFYYLFYVFFFGCFLFLIIKFLIFSF